MIKGSKVVLLNKNNLQNGKYSYRRIFFAVSIDQQSSILNMLRRSKSFSDGRSSFNWRIPNSRLLSVKGTAQN